MKKCNHCEEFKPLSEFNKHAPSPDGLHYICKPCNKVKCRFYRDRVKEAVFAYYGTVCACCGEREKTFLTLDHVNNDGADHRKSLGSLRSTSTDATWRWLVKTNFAEGDRFQILCYNCNCGKRDNGGICPHRLIESSAK